MKRVSETGKNDSSAWDFVGEISIRAQVRRHVAIIGDYNKFWVKFPYSCLITMFRYYLRQLSEFP